MSAAGVEHLDVSAAVPASHARLAESLLQELQLRDPDGSRLGQVTDLAVLAARAADSALDTAEAWTEHLGGFYDATTVGRLLSRGGRPVSRQAVHKRKGLLALTTGSGRVVYPAFQFVGGGVLPGLDAVQRAVPEELASRWTLASWLVTPQPQLDGQSPVQLLREGSVAPVLTAARDLASSLAA
ncbi:hypothetical protein DQ238_11320 [Geodermatophilus sp. TF02-6]|uniref:antitoxin Xre/MbcA/ParS toxin-binding domain-containing protein n=1 Tax=Geodermatophilus sp. TF02-6 TaxID=2250575 RepID=UPI000DEA44FE|nr:antitoxin Xre/MbcA/ParS toxin-binding domain-containing protein [Geodermatophilus sp. TF02-6]RBY78960.1 hypothetical protein DQ238_11320 [Geodermatophilus sp. TF02-6]